MKWIATIAGAVAVIALAHFLAANLGNPNGEVGPSGYGVGPMKWGD